MAALDEVGSLSDILNVLVDRAAVHAGRVLLVVARGDRLIGWRWHGYSADPTDARTVEIAPDDRGLIACAARTGVTATGREPAVGEPGDLSDDGQDAVAVPLRVEGHVVAVLYADAPPDAADASTAADLVRRPWPEVVGVLARHGGSMPRVDDRTASAGTPAHGVRGGTVPGSTSDLVRLSAATTWSCRNCVR